MNEATIKVGAVKSGQTQAAFSSVADGMKKVSRAIMDHGKAIKNLGEAGRKARIQDTAKALRDMGKAAEDSAKKMAKGAERDAFKSLAKQAKQAATEVKNQSTAVDELTDKQKSRLFIIKEEAALYEKISKDGKAYTAAELKAARDKIKSHKEAVDRLVKLKDKEIEYEKKLESATGRSKSATIRWYKKTQAEIAVTSKEIRNYGVELDKIHTKAGSVREVELASKFKLYDTTKIKEYSAEIQRLYKIYNSLEGESTNRGFTKFVASMAQEKKSVKALERSYRNLLNAEKAESAEAKNIIADYKATRIDRQEAIRLLDIEADKYKKSAQAEKEKLAAIELEKKKTKDLIQVKKDYNEVFSNTKTALAAKKLAKEFQNTEMTTSQLIKGLNKLKGVLGRDSEMRGLALQYRSLSVDITKLSGDAKKLAVTNQKLAKTFVETGRDGQYVRKSLALNEKAFRQAIDTSTVLTRSLGKLSKTFATYLRYTVVSSAIFAVRNSFADTVKTVQEYDQALHDLKAITQASDAETAQFAETIKVVAANTKFSLAEVAGGMKTLGQAGFTAQESIRAISGVADLATGTLSSMSTVVDLTTSAIRVFQLEASDTSHVADVFANAVNKSKLNIDKLRIAFNYVGPIAKAAGVSFEDLATTMAILGNAGIRASTIGTGLRKVFSKVVNPTEKFTQAVKEAGLVLDDLNPKHRTMQEVMANLSLVVKDADDAFRLFGMRGSAAVAALAQAGGTEFAKMANLINRTGTAASMAREQMEGLGIIAKNISDKIGVLKVVLSEKSGVTWLMLMLGKTTQVALDGLINLAENGVLQAIMAFTALTTSVGALAFAIKAVEMSMASGWLLKFAQYLAAVTLGMDMAAASTWGFAGSMQAVGASFAAIAPWAAAALAAIALVAYTWKNYREESVEALVKSSAEVRRQTEDLEQYADKLDEVSDSMDSATPGTEEYIRLQNEHSTIVNELHAKYPDLSADIKTAAGNIREEAAAVRELNEAELSRLSSINSSLARKKAEDLEKQYKRVQYLQRVFDEGTGAFDPVMAKNMIFTAVKSGDKRVAKSLSSEDAEYKKMKIALFDVLDKVKMEDRVIPSFVSDEYMARMTNEIATYEQSIKGPIVKAHEAIGDSVDDLRSKLVGLFPDDQKSVIDKLFGDDKDLADLAEHQNKIKEILALFDKAAAEKGDNYAGYIDLINQAGDSYTELVKNSKFSGNLAKITAMGSAYSNYSKGLTADKDKRKKLQEDLDIKKKFAQDSTKVELASYRTAVILLNKQERMMAKKAKAIVKKLNSILTGVDTPADLLKRSRERASAISTSNEADKTLGLIDVNKLDKQDVIDTKRVNLDLDVFAAEDKLEMVEKDIKKLQQMSKSGVAGAESKELKDLMSDKLKYETDLSKAKQDRIKKNIGLDREEFNLEVKRDKEEVKNLHKKYKKDVELNAKSVAEKHMSVVKAAEDEERLSDDLEKSELKHLEKMRDLAESKGLKDKALYYAGEIEKAEMRALAVRRKNLGVIEASNKALDAMKVKEEQIKSAATIDRALIEANATNDISIKRASWETIGEAKLAPLKTRKAQLEKDVKKYNKDMPGSEEAKKAEEQLAIAKENIRKQELANKKFYASEEMKLMDERVTKEQLSDKEIVDMYDAALDANLISKKQHDEAIIEETGTATQKFGLAWSKAYEEATENYDLMAEMGTYAFTQLSDGMVDVFTSIADGSKSAKDAFSDFARSFLKQIAQMILKSLILEAIGSTGDKEGKGSSGLLGMLFSADGGSIQKKAGGGKIQGYSPSPTADNIPVMATANEFMEPVSSVKHYGLRFMEAVRTRMFPKNVVEAVMQGMSVDTARYPQAKYAFADGGAIPATAAQAQDITVRAGDTHFSVANIFDVNEINEKWLQSAAGKGTMINFITTEQTSVKGVLGG